MKEALSNSEISKKLKLKQVSGQLSKNIQKLEKDGLLERIEKELNDPNQKNRITEKGKAFLEMLKKK
jgi:DNA-binding PadR family transcriptional regulator